MSMALFDLEPPAWAPIYHSRGGWENRGVTATESTPEEWKAYRDAVRCRDCGSRRFPHTLGCGGAGAAGIFDVCDGCAELDGCHEWEHSPEVGRFPHPLGYKVDVLARCSCGWFVMEPQRVYSKEPVTPDQILDAIAEHVQYTHASRWGCSHKAEDHGRLVDEREKRRAAYRREVGL